MLGSATRSPETHDLRARRADAQRRIGVRAQQVQGLLDPVHSLDVAVSHLPVAAERRHHRDRLLGAGLRDRPSEGRAEVLDLGVQPGEVRLGAGTPKRAVGSVSLREREVVAVVLLTHGLDIGV